MHFGAHHHLVLTCRSGYLLYANFVALMFCDLVEEGQLKSHKSFSAFISLSLSNKFEKVQAEALARACLSNFFFSGSLIPPPLLEKV